MVEHDPFATTHSDGPGQTIKSAQAPGTPDIEQLVPPVANANEGDIHGGKSLINPNTARPTYVPRVPHIPPPPPLPRESAARVRARKRRTHRHGGGSEWAWVIVALAMFGVVIILGIVIVLALRTSHSEPEILPTASADVSALPTAVSLRTNIDQQFESGEPVTLDNGYSFLLEPWDGESRFTMLVMGMDRRPGATGLAYLTDTLMVISIDPDTRRIGILSIPRDLYVAVPGYAERQRVNTPMLLGEARRDTTGPELAMQTVQYNLGIRIHEYLVVDFNAFIGLVDAIGGIDVTIDYTINDSQYPDMNYGYDPFYLPAGTQHLDGYEALRFARTRHGNSDIDRAQRQQQTLYAIRDRILNFNMLPQLIVHAPTLLSAFEDHVYTNLSLEEMIRLAWYVKDIPKESITTGVINWEYVQNWETPSGQQVLIPNQRRLGDLMTRVFGANYTQ